MTRLVTIVSIIIISVLAGWPVWESGVSAIRRQVRRNSAPKADAGRFAALEAAHTKECLSALTPADIEWLHWWGWEPPLDVLYRMNSYRQQEREHAAAGEKLTPAQLAAVDNARPTSTEQADALDRLVLRGVISTGDPTYIY